MAQRLRDATSPYLLQHADNPVDWWPWCDEAFEQARRRDVPVLLSVGYSACHWCHVMAHESFEDRRTADLMNENLVAIKVDREERPDVDAVYMAATQALTGQGGWPMTVFLTPDREPFFCGTYFRPDDFRVIISAVTRAWHENRDDVAGRAREIVTLLGRGAGTEAGTRRPADTLACDRAVEALADQFDARRGGFGGAPKFPPSGVLEFLLRYAERAGDLRALVSLTPSGDGEAAGDEADRGGEGRSDGGGRSDGEASAGGRGHQPGDQVSPMVARTVEAMARGGICDQIGGGFARYSVDSGWHVPHFEKMLYDNAQLAVVYTHWWRRSGSALAERVARQTCDWMLADLRTSEGGFASSLDADSGGEEGAFYTWTPAELTGALGPDDGEYASQIFAVTEAGSFERGRSVPRLPADPQDPWRYERVRAALLDARSVRPRPARDDKVVAAWNGLAITALAQAGLLLRQSGYIEAAREAARLIARIHLADGRLARTSRDGVAGPSAGLLEDYACVAAGFLDLSGATGEQEWTLLAGELLDTVLDRFRDPDGGFFDTADDSERLIYRPADPADGPTPSGTSAAAGALLSYAALTGSRRHREAAEDALGAAAAVATRYPRAAGWGLAATEALNAGPVQIAIVGPTSDRSTAELHYAAALGAPPGAVIAIGDPGAESPGALTPLLAGRGLIGGRPAAYVCRDFTCRLPVTAPRDLLAMLDQ